MRRKKLLSVLLIGAMSAALLAGCGGSSEESAETAGAAGSAAEETVASEDFTKFDETQTIEMYGLSFFGDGGLDEVMDAVNEITESEINVHVNFHPLDTSTYFEQIGLMLSGGEAFDLLLGTVNPVVSFDTMVAQNEALDISPYLDTYAPEMKELLGDYLNATTSDGAVYGVPCYRIYNSDYYIIMRKDILDELGLTEQAENMTSWSDYEEILKQVQAAQSTLPEELQTNAVLSSTDGQGNVLTGQYTDVGADAFADDFGFETLGDQTGIIMVDDDGTVVNYFATDDYRSAIERVTNWYNEGLIYKDSATTDDTGDTMMKNGMTFSYTVQSEVGVEASKKSATGYEVVCVPYVSVPVQTSNGNSWEWTVPVTSENPEAAVAFLNLFYTNADIENLFVYGIEGRDYTLNDDGEACLSADLEYQASDFFFGNQFNAYPQEGSGANFREEALAQMEDAEMSPYYGCVIDTDPIANEITAVSTVLDKYQAGLESGILGVDAIDQLNADLEASGLQTVLDYYQEQMDAWVAEQ